MEHQEILHRCFRCGYCKLPGNYTDINCPSYLASGFETYSPGGRMWLLRAWLEEKVALSPRLMEILFSCAACGNCVQHCAFPEFKDRLLPAFIAGKEALLDLGQAPGPVRDVLTNLQTHGNPYGLSRKKREAWAEGLGLDPFTDQEYLFIADDVGSYDTRGREIARSVASLLKKMGISFGLPGAGVTSDGNDARDMGESALFEDLAYHNIRLFTGKKIQKIITLSPHTYNALKNAYPQLGGNFQVFHYTQILAFFGYVKDLRGQDIRVTFHDPCYLGRHNGDYDSPRTILRSLPGVHLVEVDRNRKNALCCGGGGGNVFTNMISSDGDTAARSRVREAVDTGADVLAVACPLCAVMLKDAVIAENIDRELQVMEVSELLLS